MVDSVTGRSSLVQNHYEWVKGVRGSALKFDGFTTVIEIPGEQAPKLQKDLAIEAWVALQSYPWNWLGVVDRHENQNSGYTFGIDAEGRLGLQIAV